MTGIILGPSDGQVSNKGKSDATHSHFGGNREYTPNKPRSENDYLKETLGAPNRVDNPVDETTRDVDDMSDPKDITTRAKKREFQRRAETNDHADHNKEYFHNSDSENIPQEDTGATLGDADNRRGSANKYHFGDGVAKDVRKTEGEIY
jgi:hypothetical protein